MKKKLGILIAVFCLLLATISGANLQKTYQMDDEVWLRTDRLCRMTGHLGPTPASPISGAEILQALQRLDYASLTEWQKAEYDAIEELLVSSDGLTFKSDIVELDPTVFLGAEAYPFYSSDNVTYVEEFFIPYRDRIPLFYAEAEAYFMDNVYLDLQWLIKDGPQGFTQTDSGAWTSLDGHQYYYFTNFSHVISLGIDGRWHFMNDWSGDFKNTSFNYQPVKAGGAIGNSFMSLWLGRTRQAFGNGITGNFIIGDNFSYQEALKASVFSDIISYSLSLTHFDQLDADTGYGTSLSGIHQNRIIHRLDFNIMNKVRVAINLGGLFVTDSPFDLRFLSPLMIVHNWNNNYEGVTIQNRDEGNNILGIELEYSFLPGWFVSGQVVIDQFQLPTEKGSSVPEAFGVLLNMKNITRLSSGYLESWIEGVYTSPYLYLNTKQRLVGYEQKDDGTYKLDDEGKKIPIYEKTGDYDFILGYGWYQNRTKEMNYTGHSFGPDTIALALGSTYTSADYKWNVSGELLYKVHGEHGMSIKNYWEQNDSNRVESGEEFAKLSPSGIAEHTFMVELGAGYKILDNLDFSISAASISQWNYHNQKGVFKQSLQAAVGLSWKII